jgi:hypothetical protein
VRPLSQEWRRSRQRRIGAQGGKQRLITGVHYPVAPLGLLRRTAG